MSNNSWQDFITEQIHKLPLIRTRLIKNNGGVRNVQIESQEFISFINNDYLGLSQHQSLINAMYQSSLNYGVGSTGAPSLGGYSEEHHLLGKEIAAWLGLQRCILFNSGYQLNSSLFAQLVSSHTLIWLDSNCHASHIDGVLLSRAKFTRFNRNNIDEMEDKILKNTSQLHIIITEGTFSMDGLSNYLGRLLRLKRLSPANILLIVDDAHGIGALGNNGKGSIEKLGLNLHDIDLLIGTFGKAFGSHGGFICGSHDLIEYLQQSVRSQIFSTNLPPSIIAASRASLAIISSAEGFNLRKSLANNITYFQQLADKCQLDVIDCQINSSPIQLIKMSNAEQTIRTHQNLFDNNILVGKILYPTVAKNSPRIRISINALHEKADLEKLVMNLTKSIKDVQ